MKILLYICVHTKNSNTQIAHYNTFYRLRYAHFRYVNKHTETIKYDKK